MANPILEQNILAYVNAKGYGSLYENLLMRQLTADTEKELRKVAEIATVALSLLPTTGTVHYVAFSGLLDAINKEIEL